jgi:hypothetical protein
MDPYLERPELWPDVHARIITRVSEVLTELLRPDYFVRIEERVYISEEGDPGRREWIPDVEVSIRPEREEKRPVDAGGHLNVAEPIVARTLLDEEIRERYLEITDRARRKVVTVIEVLSPTNKVARSRGLKSFRAKRKQVMNSASHWVEIDLLRAGVTLPLRKRLPPHEYFVHISPVQRRPDGLLWPIRLDDRLPALPIPLRTDDEVVPLDLQGVLGTVYDRAGYDLELDYTAAPRPPLDPKWQDWAHHLLCEKGMRTSARA